MTSQAEKSFLVHELANMFNVKIQLGLHACVYFSYEL